MSCKACDSKLPWGSFVRALGGTGKEHRNLRKNDPYPDLIQVGDFTTCKLAEKLVIVELRCWKY
jgi:hypothetical protein